MSFAYLLHTRESARNYLHAGSQSEFPPTFIHYFSVRSTRKVRVQAAFSRQQSFLARSPDIAVRNCILCCHHELSSFLYSFSCLKVPVYNKKIIQSEYMKEYKFYTECMHKINSLCKNILFDLGINFCYQRMYIGN